MELAEEQANLKELLDNKSLIGDIFKNSNLFGDFGLDEFLDTEDIKYFDSLDMFKKDDKIFINCLIKNKPKVAKSEEIVRQLYLLKLTKHYNYPLSHIDIERPVQFGREIVKRDDIVVYRDHTQQEPYIIVEIKKPDVKQGMEQLKAYGNATGAPLLVLTNGKTTHVLERTDPNLFENLIDLPKFGQNTDSIRNDKLTYDQLEPSHDLRQLVTNIENAILANSGVNTFDEIFKLIYAKLYDEIDTPKNDDRIFKVTSDSNQQHLEKIENLFQKAKARWGEGVFDQFDSIKIPANAIVPAISLMQGVRIYNGNFQVIDEAFEYLITSDSKGEKGQYFTPRYVIDMCVRMLKPKKDEYMIDTAAGSGGFPVHVMRYVWDHEFTPDKYGDSTKELRTDYARDYIYAIDFDTRATRISKAVMLIAGDGKTHMINANSLDPTVWSNDAKAALNNRLLNIKDSQQNLDNKKLFKFFDFDIIMTNPPFAGDVNGNVLYNYDLARNGSNKIKNKVSREILFIERNLNFLKPGGRMAIVLPQGIFNNSSMNDIRQYFMGKARILAVVGLHVNTFKPHTGTKTSVLFLQKWDGEAGDQLEDYPIFMAVSEKAGKDNSGSYVYKKDSDGTHSIDADGNKVYDTDLPDIAEAFIKWGKEQGFSFL